MAACMPSKYTGEKVWSLPLSKRAINTGVAVSGNTVFLSHGDENLEGVELGIIAALDGAQSGDLKTTKWATKGIEFSYSSPIVDGNRLYQLDNGSTLRTFDTASGVFGRIDLFDRIFIDRH